MTGMIKFSGKFVSEKTTETCSLEGGDYLKVEHFTTSIVNR